METRYARTVAKFESITIVLSGLGASYNPGQELIKLPAVLSILADAKAALLAVDDAQAAYAVAVDAGERLFRDIRSYAVNIKRTAAVEINDAEFTAGLQAIVNRLSSKPRAVPTVSGLPALVGSVVPGTGGETPSAPRARSGPNTGRDSQVALLGDMLALLKTRPEYQPEEAEYSIAGIEQRINDLNAASVRIRETASAKARAAQVRNSIIFDETTGITKRVNLIKTYLARTPTSQSSARRQISGITI